MKLYKLCRKQFLPISIKTAWKFYSNPHNLAQITPKWLDFRITNHVTDKIYPGLIISYRIKTLLRMPTTWVSEITHVDKPLSFVDEMRIGPYRFWHHRHLFIEKAGGVDVADIIHYALKFGLFGQILHKVAIRAKLKEIFDYRRNSLEKIFG